MPVIKIETLVLAPKQKLFDLCLDMDVHQAGMSIYKEKAISGVTSGPISLGETVTWRAKHFGFFQKLTVEITEMDTPHYFADEMVKGTFKRFKHSHYFEDKEEGTLMIDVFDFNSPLGALGRLVDKLVLTKYMTKLLMSKNEYLKRISESHAHQLQSE